MGEKLLLKLIMKAIPEGIVMEYVKKSHKNMLMQFAEGIPKRPE